MALRNRGTNRNGGGFDEATVQAVWNKGRIIPGKDPSKVRADACGVWMVRDKYGETVERGFGWEIDHIVPVSQGGSDSLSNLQPLQWQNNRAKGDGALVCAVVRPKTKATA